MAEEKDEYLNGQSSKKPHRLTAPRQGAEYIANIT